MKVSYIITPMTDTAHLVRCINSIYRQIGTDYYVILAESFAGSENKGVTEYLQSLRSLIRISDKAESFEEKVNEAISLIPADSDYVMFVDVTSVISSAATQIILQQKGAELIVPATAKRVADNFKMERPDVSEIINELNEHTPWRFCFAKSVILEIPVKCLENQYRFLLSVLPRLTNADSIAVTNDICIYIEDHACVKKNDYTADHTVSDVISLSKMLHTINDPQTKIALFSKITHDIMEFATGRDKSVKNQMHSLLQTICGIIQDDILLKKIFENKVGCEAKVFMKLSREEYDICRDMELYSLVNSWAPQIDITQIDILGQKKITEDIYVYINELRAGLDEIKSDLDHVTENQRTMMVSLEKQQDTVFIDPVLEIPGLYAQGRLGFRVIWRSFGEWLKYKFRRKK